MSGIYAFLFLLQVLPPLNLATYRYRLSITAVAEQELAPKPTSSETVSSCLFISCALYYF